MTKRFVPLEMKDFPSPRKPHERRQSQFKASWGKTLEKLDYELERIGARDVIVQAGFQPYQIRNDGWPYGKATPTHPACVVSCRDRGGNALSFPCDTYLTIDDNLRAIALSLEALRAVDRFGVTRRAEQYMGFKAIEAPRAMTVEDAAEFVRQWAAGGFAVGVIEESPTAYRAAYRAAAIRLHPDTRGGETGLWHKLAEAKKILDAHHAYAVEQVAR